MFNDTVEKGAEDFEWTEAEHLQMEHVGLKLNQADIPALLVQGRHAPLMGSIRHWNPALYVHHHSSILRLFR